MATISAYETANGRRYRVRYRKPDRTQTDKRGFKTKREAELFASSVEVAKARGEFIDATAARATIGVLGAEWLATQTHLKPSTARSIESAWRVHVEPVWGGRAVADVRHSEVQTWVTRLARTKSATTAKRAHGILSSILQRAEKDRRVATNAARGVNLPRKKARKHIYLSHNQVDALASNAGEQATLVRFLAYTGLRWGEATALRVRDLDLLRLRASVVENAVRVGGRIVVGTPKSHRSRSVPIPQFLAESVSRLCEGKSRDALLFGDGGYYVRPPSSQSGWFERAVRATMAADVSFERVTPHDLRHTTASLAISAGANVKAVQRMLGHASAAMTLDIYADLFDDDLDAVGAALNHAAGAATVGRMWANGRESTAVS
ncbi:site-specific recombinase XerD [Agromyces ramosus]|uniref:Site-specific recombinase XerD n=1 Tax=Agromyces ramosus TaxID=33879 RepID=A0A4Q7MKA4_9MICO|nr:tyrosine-type recombinase/integrase [Agromyces ramosus]RZS68706.1 site-specific recombinase XerD [Agromyces ramosus]